MAKPKTKVLGRRYSKVRQTTYTPENIREMPDRSAEPLVGSTDWIHRAAARYRAWLVRERGVPDALVIYWRPDGTWTAQALPMTTPKTSRTGPLTAWGSLTPPSTDARACWKSQTLAHYAAEHFERDSLEDLAARFVWEAYLLEHATGDEAIRRAFTLGELHTLLRVYETDSITARNRAHKRHKPTDTPRDNKRAIREIWASGAYADRDACAAGEYKRLGITQRTARDYLKGTPDPDR